MTDNLAGTTPGGWLAEPEHPALAGPGVVRINDPHRPDRLAWNAFRTLALWNTDGWVPSLLELACGDRNPLSPLEWGEHGSPPVGRASFSGPGRRTGRRGRRPRSC